MNKFAKALENIRKVMQAQDEEFRLEAGLAPRDQKPEPKIPSLKPEPVLEDSHKDSGGKFAANRFLETSIGQEPAHESAAHHETQTQDTAPEIVEVLPQKDSRHSWLYNEVAKAVQNASGGNPNTKVVAVFVPVVQSGHELEDLPVHETVELPPVNEDDFRIEDEIDIQNDPVPADSVPQEPDEPIAAESEPDEPNHFVFDESKPEILEENDFSEGEPSQQEEPVISEPEHQEPEDIPEPQEPVTADAEPQESAEPDLPEELTAEPEQAEHLDELIPESIEHPDPELAEAYSTIEEKLDESISAEQEQPETDETAESLTMPENEETADFTENAAENSESVSEFSAVDMSEFDITGDDDFSEGEKMPFTEIPPDEDSGDFPDLELPDALEDDEIIIDDIDESSEDSKTN